MNNFPIYKKYKLTPNSNYLYYERIQKDNSGIIIRYDIINNEFISQDIIINDDVNKISSENYKFGLNKFECSSLEFNLIFGDLLYYNNLLL